MCKEKVKSLSDQSVFVILEDYGWAGGGPVCFPDGLTIKGFPTREDAQAAIDSFDVEATRLHTAQFRGGIREVRVA